MFLFSFAVGLVVLDLADEDGNLLNLPEHHPRRNAFRLVQAKVTYIPILIESKSWVWVQCQDWQT